MTSPLLSCPVRGCHAPLKRAGTAWVCERRHSFDVARSGYVNLLQPQDRRSLQAGDSAESVRARESLIVQGVGRATIDAVVALARALPLREAAVVVELGSGTGDTIGRLATGSALSAVGIDLSTAAGASAARRFPDVTWVVANADRRLPLVDGSVDLVLSVHARRNPAECHRVLGRDGFLIVAIPAADDLVELREAVLGAGIERDRAADLVYEHADLFTIVDRKSVRQMLDVSREALLLLLRGTYRGARLAESERVADLRPMTVTLASEIIVFAPRRRPPRDA